MKTHKPNLKTKLRIHLKKNILSFNKCKLDTMWPINKCMSRENIFTLLSIINKKNKNKNQFSAFHTSRKLAYTKMYKGLKN